MTRKWDKIGEGKYAFSTDDQQIGEMDIAVASNDTKAICRIGKEEYVIKRTGFWKSGIEIKNNRGETVIRTYHEKWYANSSVLEYGDKKYKLIIHNNPLAEYSIKDGDNSILAYGLDAGSGKVNVRITAANTTTDYLFDFLLWYLFLPIATENMGDNLTFLLLATA